MPFRPEPDLPDFLALIPILNTSREQTENNPLYQTLIELLDRDQRLRDIFNKRIKTLEADVEILDESVASTSRSILPFIPPVEEDDASFFLLSEPNRGKD